MTQRFPLGSTVSTVVFIIDFDGFHNQSPLLTMVSVNRPFYRYGGHIELIRFKEYYRMPKGHEHISFVFSSAFQDIFSKRFLRIRL